MNTSNAAKCDSIVRRNLRRKNVYLWPLRRQSLLGVTMGILMLMAMATSSAHATSLLLSYWNFNDVFLVGENRFESDAPGLQTGILIQNGPTNSFPTGPGSGGHFLADGADAGLVNLASGDSVPPAGTGFSLDVGGNTSNSPSTPFCFTTQAINTMGATDINVTFALESTGNNHQFSELKLSYSTTSQTDNGSNFTQFADIALTTAGVSNFPTFATTGGSFTLAAPTTTLFLEFCFFDQSSNAEGNHTFIDNIQVRAVPEPATVFSGVFAAIGLCWFQRRWLVRSLRFRRA